jgi:hypothetical protein
MMSVIIVVVAMALIGVLQRTDCAMPVEKRGTSHSNAGVEVFSSVIVALTLISSILSVLAISVETHVKQFQNVSTFPVEPDHYSSKMWTEFVKTSAGIIEFKMDTGAEVNVLPKKLLHKMYGNNFQLNPTPIVLEVYGGSLLRPVGSIVIPNCKLNNISLDLEFIVADVESVPLLSLQSCENFKLVKRTTSSNLSSRRKVYKVSLNASVNAAVVYNGPDSLKPDCSPKQYFKINKAKKKVHFAKPLVTYMIKHHSSQSLPYSPVNLDNLLSRNNDVFTTEVGCFPGKYSININENYKPVAIPSRRVPHKIKPRYEAYLKELCNNGIIKKCSNPQGWISPVVLVEKTNGSLRLCLDPKYLNEAMSRPFFEIPSAEDINSSLANKKFFSVLDFSSGFWHCQLDSKSSNLCKFSTPFGVFQFLRLPFGLSVSPEIFQQAVVDIFGNIDGVLVYFDDLLIAADSEEEHDMIFNKVLERAQQYNVHFNPTKLQYKMKSVKFLGHIYSEHGRSIDPSRIEAIKNLKIPDTVKSLQRLLGMINYVREFVPNLADDTYFLTQLLRKNVLFQWLPEHTEALNNIKNKLCNAASLSNFNPKEQIVLQCDASQYGLGICLMQSGKPVAYSSRSLTKSEQNYAQIEKELLAIVFACQKLHYYICGHPDIIVHTDHKPLVSIFKQPLSQISSSRLTRLILKTVAYKLQVNYLPGKLMHIADALSRDFLDCNPNEEVKMYQVHSVSSRTNCHKDQLYVHFTETDKSLQEIVCYIQSGWPRKKHCLSKEAQTYWPVRNELYIENSLVYYRNRLVVPSALRPQMLKMIHEGHQGIVKCKSLARYTLYWPGISKDIDTFVKSCLLCAKFAPSQRRQPLVPLPVPDLPFQLVASDILEFKGKSYLVLIDFYSKWLEVMQLSSKSAESVIRALEVIFSIHGSPDVLFADNNPFPSYKMQEFAKLWNFKITTCSPHFHQSNGLAEKAVDISKSFLEKCSVESSLSLAKCLLTYRITPIPGLNYSPAQLLMSRQLKGTVPVHTSRLIPCVIDDVPAKLQSRKEKMKSCYDRTAHRSEVMFSVGDKVFVQNPLSKIWEPGIVLDVCDEPRSYIVQNNSSNIRRNVKFLKPNLSELNVSLSTLPFYLMYNSLTCNEVPVHSDDIPVPNVHQDNSENEWRDQYRRSSRIKKPVNRLVL